MSQQIARFEDTESWYDGIAAFVKLGLTFEACHSELTITLSGGY